jgi:hypothetical protein
MVFTGLMRRRRRPGCWAAARRRRPGRRDRRGRLQRQAKCHGENFAVRRLNRLVALTGNTVAGFRPDTLLKVSARLSGARGGRRTGGPPGHRRGGRRCQHQDRRCHGVEICLSASPRCRAGLCKFWPPVGPRLAVSVAEVHMLAPPRAAFSSRHAALSLRRVELAPQFGRMLLLSLTANAPPCPSERASPCARQTLKPTPFCRRARHPTTSYAFTLVTAHHFTKRHNENDPRRRPLDYAKRDQLRCGGDAG